MNIKQKFILAIATILIISFTIVSVTYSFFINNKPVIDNNLYVHYQNNSNLITLSNLSDSITIYKYIKVSSKNDVNYSIGIVTNYDTVSFRDGVSQEEVNVDPSLMLKDSDGYYDNIFISLVSNYSIDETNLEDSFNDGKIIFKETNLIKDNKKQILKTITSNDEKYYIIKIEYRNDPLLPVNNLSNANILFNIYDASIVIK